MEFFSIRNHDSDSDASFVSWDRYSNILRPDIEAALPELEAGVEIIHPLNREYDESKDICVPDMGKPLLFEHFKNLSSLWKNFKSNSFITNRRTMKLLSQTRKPITLYLTIKNLIIENEEPIFYILNAEPVVYVDFDKVNSRYTLVESATKIGYTEYFCKSKVYNGFTFHYTNKMDAFQASTEKPFEIKSLKNQGNLQLGPFIAYNIAVHCCLADVSDILCGFYDEAKNEVTVKLYTLEYLRQRAALKRLNVDAAIHEMEKNIEKITNFVHQHGTSLIGKTIKISKNAGESQFRFDFE